MALILHRVMRARLHAAHTGLSPERALEQLTRIQHHRIRIAQGDPVTGVSTINAEQAGTFSALGVGEETGGFAAVTAAVVERFKTALNKNNRLRH